MRPISTGCVVVFLLTSGCSPPPRPAQVAATPAAEPAQFVYLAPTAAPRVARQTIVGQPLALAHRAVFEAVTTSPLSMSLSDPHAGFVVATYSGSPEPYIDCGWIVVVDRQSAAAPRQYNAASPSAEFSGPAIGIDGVLARGLQLDARTAVRLEPIATGDDTLVTIDTTYVLTKTVTAREPDGRVRGQTRESIRFSTGDRAAFRPGTICHSTGQLEMAILQRLPARTGFGDLTAGGDGRPLY